jgi:transposase-like protein
MHEFKVTKVTRTKGSFPAGDSLFKILYLIVMDMSEKWTMPFPNGGQILGQLIVYYGERVEAHL